MPENVAERLAVCTWSLRPGSVEELIEELKQIGIMKVHLALNPIAEDKAWADAGARLRDAGIEIVAGMLAYPSEDYSTMDRIKETGGVVPDDAWNDNWEITQRVAKVAGALKLDLVTFHAGFLPHESTDPQYQKLKARLELIADLFGSVGCKLGFETGQEEASTLKDFLADMDNANVGVNFDPANMILYDKGNPIEALRLLGDSLFQCHLKDANKTDKPGTWGTETAVGDGQVDWKAFFDVLDEVGFKGYLAFEREAGAARRGDIVKGKEYILGL